MLINSQPAKPLVDVLAVIVQSCTVQSCIFNKVVKLPVIYVGGKLPVSYR